MSDETVKQADAVIEAAKVLTLGPSDLLAIRFAEDADMEAVADTAEHLRTALDAVGIPPERVIMTVGVGFDVVRKSDDT